MFARSSSRTSAALLVLLCACRLKSSSGVFFLQRSFPLSAACDQTTPTFTYQYNKSSDYPSACTASSVSGTYRYGCLNDTFVNYTSWSSSDCTGAVTYQAAGAVDLLYPCTARPDGGLGSSWGRCIDSDNYTPQASEAGLVSHIFGSGSVGCAAAASEVGSINPALFPGPLGTAACIPTANPGGNASSPWVSFFINCNATGGFTIREYNESTACAGREDFAPPENLTLGACGQYGDGSQFFQMTALTCPAPAPPASDAAASGGAGLSPGAVAAIVLASLAVASAAAFFGVRRFAGGAAAANVRKRPTAAGHSTTNPAIIDM